MNLLIKGTEMPISCNDCAMRYMSIGYDYECVFTNDFVGDCIEHRLANCPLEEVHTPHGRLIDADRLIVALKNSVYANTFFRTPTLTMSQIEQLIEHQPTIIDAEE